MLSDRLTADAIRIVAAATIVLAFSACGGGGGGGSSPNVSTVAVVTQNSPPVASASNQLANEEQPVVLDGSASNDQDGSVASYEWSQLSGTAVVLADANSALARFDAPSVAVREELEFQLRVTDNDGATSSTSVVVTINAAPISIAGDDEVVMSLATVALDGSASNDVDGEISLYSWSQVSGPQVQIDQTDSDLIQFEAPDVATSELVVLQLAVTDNDGATGLDYVSIEISVAGSVDNPVSIWSDNLVVIELGPDDIEAGNLFDLEGTTIRFVPDGSGYRVQSESLQWDADFGTELQESASEQITLTNFQFPFSGSNWNSIFVGAFGSITFGQDQSAFYDPARDRFLLFRSFSGSMVSTIPIISPLFHRFALPFDPDEVSRRFVREHDDRMVVTWLLSEPYLDPFAFTIDPRMNRFQAVLHENGEIVFSYSEISVDDGIAGVFPLSTAIENLNVISDPEDVSLPPYIDTLSVTASIVGNHSIRFEFDTRGDVLAEGDPILSGIGYRVFVDLDEPFIQGVNFVDPDLEFAIGVTPQLEYQGTGPGVSPIVQTNGGSISMTVALDALGDVSQFAFFTDAVDFDDQPGTFDQTDPIIIEIPNFVPAAADLSATVAAEPGRSVIYEAFFYPDIPPAEALTCSVLNSLGDEFDFLAFYTDFRIDRQEAGASGLGAIGDSVSGVIESFSDPSRYCSNGRFQSGQLPTYIGAPMFAEIGTDASGPFSAFGRHISLLSHEIGHRWLTTQFAETASGNVMIGNTAPHWVFNLHTPVAFPGSQPNEASIMDGNYWQDNGDGTFTKLTQPFFQTSGYSYLDLYLMGFLPQQNVPDFFLIEDSEFENTDGDGNEIWSGTRVNISVDDEVAHHGPRLPEFEDSQKDFNIGFVGIVPDGQLPSPMLLDRMAGVREQWMLYWSAATGGVSSMSSTPIGPE